MVSLLRAKFPIPSERSERLGLERCSGTSGVGSRTYKARCLSPADPSQTTALAASEEVETDAAVLAAGETEVGAYFRDV